MKAEYLFLIYDSLRLEHVGKGKPFEKVARSNLVRQAGKVFDPRQVSQRVCFAQRGRPSVCRVHGRHVAQAIGTMRKMLRLARTANAAKQTQVRHVAFDVNGASCPTSSLIGHQE